RFTQWFGVRAGKVKTTLGLFNDSQDLDSLHVFALLPQGVYPTDLRDTSIAHTGVDIYGRVPLRRQFGELSFTAYAGHRSDSIYSGYPYLLRQWGFYVQSVTGPQYGGDLRWDTPVKGLTIGLSRMNQDGAAKGFLTNTIIPVPAPIPYQTTSKQYWTNQLYGEYRWGKLRVGSEFKRVFYVVPILPGSGFSSDMRAWYVSGSYRLNKHLTVGSYYSRYTEINLTTGMMSAIIQTQTNTSLPGNHVYDTVLAARFDLNRFVYAKIEGHFMDGYGIGPYPNGFYPQQNPNGFDRSTNALVIKSGFHF
ncbi:MAG TPA: hypothetical protein VE866_18500, partial [Candidatus Binatia bacterium]|nr:hypothetical protein [Candidatus Binatia bacterium]